MIATSACLIGKQKESTHFLANDTFKYRSGITRYRNHEMLIPQPVSYRPGTGTVWVEETCLLSTTAFMDQTPSATLENALLLSKNPKGGTRSCWSGKTQPVPFKQLYHHQDESHWALPLQQEPAGQTSSHWNLINIAKFLIPQLSATQPSDQTGPAAPMAWRLWFLLPSWGHKGGWGPTCFGVDNGSDSSYRHAIESEVRSCQVFWAHIILKHDME